METACTHRQLIKFLDLLTQKGITPEAFQLRFSSGAFADILDPAATFKNRAALRKAVGLHAVAPEEGFEVTVDYNRSLAEMMQAAKVFPITDRFTEQHPYEDAAILEQFTVEGNRVVTSKLFFMPCEDSMKKEQVLGYVAYRDCRPANLAEMLALFEQYPDAWKNYEAPGDIGDDLSQLCAIGANIRSGGADYFPVISRLDMGDKVINELSVGNYLHGGLMSDECVLVALK